MTDQKTGIQLIAEERQRQIEKENWTAEHDSQYENEELALAGAIYATPERWRSYGPDKLPLMWPWEQEWWKPTPENRIRELTKAGALIAAQLDRELAKEAEAL
jgi:hypothetical protein